MIVETIKKLMEYVREGEYCSCPFIVSVDNTIRIALFTYYASDEHPIVVYGYGQFLSYDGNNVIAEEKDLFEHYNSCDRQVFVETVSELFKKLIPDDALEMYRRICPDYLMMLKI